MTTTMQLIAKQTVGSGGATSVTFSNIPQTFTDLKVIVSARTQSPYESDNAFVTFNGSSSGYSEKTMQDINGTVYSFSASSAYLNWACVTTASAATANTFGNSEFYIPNYASSNYKSVSADGSQENNGTPTVLAMTAGLWSNSAAITSITLTPANPNFVSGSTFYLYGISKSSTQNTSVPLASGGDVITTDGTYWYHAFKYSGSFTPLKNLTADVLVIAGGGSGGAYTGNGAGGGGAGGLLIQTGRSITTSTISVVIGAGGTGIANASGNTGSNTTFDTITALGGGAGTKSGSGGSGGSGGGAPGGGAGSQSGGSATQGNSGGATGYGNAGGSNASGSTSGGGGGAGASGGSNAGGNGAGGTGFANYTLLNAIGVATNIGQLVSGNYYFAGGGGGGYTAGGAGGYGGGGRGDDYNANNKVAGTANLGAGGGGASAASDVAGANGGSGLVVVRYAV
jgi:hypothetical protein